MVWTYFSIIWPWYVLNVIWIYVLSLKPNCTLNIFFICVFIRDSCSAAQVHISPGLHSTEHSICQHLWWPLSVCGVLLLLRSNDEWPLTEWCIVTRSVFSIEQWTLKDLPVSCNPCNSSCWETSRYLKLVVIQLVVCFRKRTRLLEIKQVIVIIHSQVLQR